MKLRRLEPAGPGGSRGCSRQYFEGLFASDYEPAIVLHFHRGCGTVKLTRRCWRTGIGACGKFCGLAILASFVLLELAGGGASPVASAQEWLPVFTDVTDEAGIHFKHSYGDYRLSNIVEGTGAGVGCFDYDGDGYLDLYFLNGAWTEGVSDTRGRELRGKLFNALYRNNGNGTFTEVTFLAGVGDLGFGFGCSAADYNADGFLDLYVLNYGENRLYRNNGDGTFTDVTSLAGLGDPRFSLAAVWFDADDDGDIDVYVANYLQYDAGKFRWYYAAAGYPGPLSYHGQPDALYRNNGDGTFEDVTHESGVYQPDGRAMSVTVADLDGDGRLDIYVPNDAMENFFFRGLGGGKFREEALEWGLAFGEGGQNVSSMGPSVGDIDRDGRLDLFIPDMSYSCLLVNRGTYFEDWTARTNLALICGQYISWGAVLFDMDNDGFLDLYVATGDAHFEFPDEDVLVWNNGQGKFIDVANRCGEHFRREYVGRGAASVDFDNDGDMDIVVVNLNDRARLLRNDGGNQNNWLKVLPKTEDGRCDALGALVTVEVGGIQQIQYLIPVVGYLSQSDNRLHFGLGKHPKADKVTIRWPNGHTTQLTDVPANCLIEVVPTANGGSWVLVRSPL